MIRVGDYVPNVKLYRMSQKGPEAISSAEWFSDRHVVLFAVPGAFTPTCSTRHLPGYLEKSEEFRSKGIDSISCISVNDVYVMDAWRRDQEVGNQIEMLADGAGLFTKAAGFVLDLSGVGYGIRSIRYAMVVKDGMITHLNLEESGKFEVSDAKTLLKLL